MAWPAPRTLLIAGLFVLGGLVFFLVKEADVDAPLEDIPSQSDRSDEAPAPRIPDLNANGDAGAVGTPENPNARAAWATRRLRNPTTGRVPAGIRPRELAFAATLPEQAAKASTWQKRGPVNVGGRTRALGIDVSDESTLLAGGVSGGIFRSTDGGVTWTKQTTPAQLHNATWLEQDPRSGHTDTWYAGTGEYRGNSASGGGGYFRGNGIFKSTDGGATWSLLSSTTSDTPQSFDSMFDYVWSIAVDPSNTADDEVYAATYGGIQRSTDGGASWTHVLGHGLFGATNRYNDVVVTAAGVVFAAVDKDADTADAEEGIFRSPDGTTWTEITPAGWPTDFDRTVLALTPGSDLWALVAASGSGPNGTELWFYDDGTGTWTDYTDFLPARGVRTGDFNTQINYNLTAAVHPDEGHLLYVGGRNLWRIDTTATDTANTWIGGYSHDPNTPQFAPYAPTGSDAHHPDQHAIAFRPSNGDVMYVGSDGGVHRTDDNRAGTSGPDGDGSVLWTSLNDAYYTTQFYTVCFNPDPSDPIVMGGMQDNGTWGTASTSPDMDWSEVWSGDGSFCSIANKSGGSGTYRYVSSQNGNVYRLDYSSSGTFQSWTAIEPNGASNPLFINPFVLDPSAPTVLFYPAGSTIWRTSDAENATVSSGWTEMTGIGGATPSTVTALDVSTASSAHVLYYGTDGGSVYRLDGADAAAASTAPADITGSGFPSGGYVSSIAVDPTNSDEVLVVFSNYGVRSIFYTTDGGNTWTDVSGDLEENPDGTGSGPSVRWATILPQGGLGQTTYYVGTSIGLYSTTLLDGTNTTWAQEGSSIIGNVVVDMVQARPADGLVLVGTHANGTYSIDAPLPVELTRFEAARDGGAVRLSWQTASETNNAGFAVQRRAEGDGEAQWTTLTFVEGRGTTASPSSYTYVDEALPFTAEALTYRLQQTDADGAVTTHRQVEVALSTSDEFTLHPNFPNPFTSGTTIRYEVPQPTDVRLTVHDVSGRTVALLANAEQAGRQELRFEGRGLASGTYFVRLRAGDQVRTQKITLVR